MGLDLVEFAIALEDAFAIHIPDEDAVKLFTPGKLVEYLERRLPPSKTRRCLDQLSFYALRRAGMKILRKPRKAFHPDAQWDNLLPEKYRRRHWELLQKATGASAWPRLTLLGGLPRDNRTVGQTARFISTKCPSNVLGRNPTWSRDEIVEVVTRLMDRNLGVKVFRMDDRFVDDLGLS